MTKAVYDTDESGVVDESESTANHASKHENGGTDEISVAGLSGELTDEQDAGKIKGVIVNDAAIGDQKVLAYDLATERIVYISPAPSGAAIESIQRGTITIPDYGLTADTTIAEVDISQSALSKLGQSGTNNDYFVLANVTFVNSTTVRAKRLNDDYVGSDVEFQVIEFVAGGVSIQNKEIEIPGGESTATVEITEVDLDKTIIVWGGTAGFAPHENKQGTRLSFDDSTTLRATREGTILNTLTACSIVEFL